MRGLSPSRCYFTLEAHFLPSQVLKVVSLFEASEVQLEQIPNTVVLSLASPEDEKSIVVDTRGMEPSGPRAHISLRIDFPPGQALEVVKPQVS